VARSTVNLSDNVEATVRELAEEGESFSRTVSRLIEAGARSVRGPKRPSYVASGDGPDDLGRMAERYLRELATSR
jgi:hypothetical protein